MSPATQKVGRVTVAIGLVAFGIALLADNLTGSRSGLDLLIKLWPLGLVGFGLEYLIRSLLLSRSGEDRRFRFDFGGAFLLALVILLSLGITTFRGFVERDGGRILLPFDIGPVEKRTEVVPISADGVRELIADVNIGSVTLQQNSVPGEIRVEATYSAQGFTLNQAETRRQLEQIHLDVTRGEVVRLEPKIPAGNILVSYVIYAPPNLTVKATTGAGMLHVVGYQGNMTLISRVGRISVEASSGSLQAGSGSGYIGVQTFDGPVSARTTIGSVEAHGVNGALQLESGTGGIYVTEFRGGRLVAETKTGGIQAATRFPLEGDVVLKTQTGTVGLTVPANSSMRVTAETRTGSLNVPPFMKTSRSGAASSAIGSSGDGAYTVSLEATTGSVNFNVQ